MNSQSKAENDARKSSIFYQKLADLNEVLCDQDQHNQKIASSIYSLDASEITKLSKNYNCAHKPKDRGIIFQQNHKFYFKYHANGSIDEQKSSAMVSEV